MAIASAEFERAALNPDDWPRWALAEVAFAGRSNVGKSSLLNRLAGRRSLARVSKTPGRTREIHFYRLRDDRREFSFVDLPGYGFAKVAQSVQAEWGGAIERYLRERANLRGVVVLVDARRDPDARDIDLVDWLRKTGRRTLVVATKADKLGRAALLSAQARLDKAVGESVVVSSVETGVGLEAIGRVMRAWTTHREAS
ncbi:MAG: YihA family ribosome biogenesis GTP-binding protein [Deltaproteobacteria bacterium]|nr:YihA family ribosome biogenesis GTP-binding protein [Deltaproteobacteria bacterium]